MKKKIYSFGGAAMLYVPRELSQELKNVALALSSINETETNIIVQMQRVVLNTCDFLDNIKTKIIEVKEVEQ